MIGSNIGRSPPRLSGPAQMQIPFWKSQMTFNVPLCMVTAEPDGDRHWTE